MLKESGSRSTSGCWHSAPAERNTAPILEVLRETLPERGGVLEVASGTGQHIVAFAKAFPELLWQPSDCDGELRRSVELYSAHAGLGNLLPPVDLDVLREPWPVSRMDAVVCINMIHVAPWRATEALFTGTRRLLDVGGPLILYGPYMRDNAHTAPSNAAFDEALKARHSDWGLRDMGAVSKVADGSGFSLERTVAMPANNFSLVFRAV